MPIRPRAFGLRAGVFGDRLPSQHRVPQAERFTVGFRGAGFLETELPIRLLQGELHSGSDLPFALWATRF